MSDTSLHRCEVIVAPEKIVQVRFSAANNKLSTLCKFRGGNMKSISRSIIVLSLFAAPVIGWTEDHSFTNDEGESHHRFRMTSTTFSDGGTLPLSMVFNQCTPYPGGGNMSPELSWTNAPRDTAVSSWFATTSPHRSRTGVCTISLPRPPSSPRTQGLPAARLDFRPTTTSAATTSSTTARARRRS